MVPATQRGSGVKGALTSPLQFIFTGSPPPVTRPLQFPSLSLRAALLCLFTFVFIIVGCGPSPRHDGLATRFGKGDLFSELYTAHAGQISCAVRNSRNIFVPHHASDIESKFIPVENLSDLFLGDRTIHFLAARKRYMRINWPNASKLHSLFRIEWKRTCLGRWIRQNFGITVGPSFIGRS